MFERLRGSIRRRLGEPERLGRAALGVLENDVLEDGNGVSFKALTEEQLEASTAEEVYTWAADLFSTLPDSIREPFASTIDAFDLMSLSEDNFSKYEEVVRIMGAKGMHIEALLFSGYKKKYDDNELCKPQFRAGE